MTLQAHPYLIFGGNCEEAMRFYQSVIGGELQIMRFSEMPGDAPVSDAVREQVAHACLRAGDVRLMASDNGGQPHDPPGGTQVSLHVDSPEEAERVFAVLSEGGSVTMPIGQTFWARRFGMAKDQFGVPWMVNCE
jgi:PhnB protein